MQLFFVGSSVFVSQLPLIFPFFSFFVLKLLSLTYIFICVHFLRRLARRDGTLLKADRPLAPMDLMIAGSLDDGRRIANASRALPGYAQGARAWATHVTCGPESDFAPEVAAQPTRDLVSHTGFQFSRFPFPFELMQQD
jgi:hypothetical protein